MFSHAWCTDNNGVPLINDEIKRYLKVVPSARQLAFQQLRYYNFIHFGVNTFMDREWGDGTEDPGIFNPSQLDTDQWCRVLKASGSKGILFTAKHHDGFCLFDTAYTDHNVMHSPYGKDIVRELANSCEKYGMKLGIYLSPWDRHESTYGTDGYNDYFVNQLTELCTGYGDIFCFWFDGACGEGPNGKKQKYDWDRYYQVIRKYQPDAIIANCGPDVRWIGNEAGKTRKSEWSVIPWTDDTLDDIAEKSQHNEAFGIECFDRMDEDIGSREKLCGKANLVWCPAEADVSMNYGWFWHEDGYYAEKGKSPCRTAKELAEIYIATVGGNASLLLNIPVDKAGQIHKRETGVLEEFTKIIGQIFREEVPFALSLVSVNGEERIPGAGTFSMEAQEAAIRLRPQGRCTTLVVEEDTRCSQRVEAFSVFADGKRITDSTCIGSCKILRFPEGIEAETIDLVITQSRSNPVIRSVRIYK